MMKEMRRTLLLFIPLSLFLAGCPSGQARPLTQPASQTIIAHYNSGGPTLAVPESVLIHAFEREFNDGTIVTGIWIETKGSQFWLIARGMNNGRQRVGRFEIVRDAANPDNMYISLKSSVRGQIGGWR
jgi:hypothetical protein